MRAAASLAMLVRWQSGGGAGSPGPSTHRKRNLRYPTLAPAKVRSHSPAKIGLLMATERWRGRARGWRKGCDCRPETEQRIVEFGSVNAKGEASF